MFERSWMRHSIVGGTALAAISLGFAATAVMAEPSQGELVIAVAQEPQDLAAQGAYKEVNAAGLRNVIETLIAQDPVSGNLTGVLATAWERIDDQTVQFTIPHNFHFSRQMKFSARDFQGNIRASSFMDTRLTPLNRADQKLAQF